MNEDYGSDYISIEDDEGNEYELEHLDTFEFDGKEYMSFLPADMDEDDPDFGLIILKVVDENGEAQLFTPDDEEEELRVYNYYMDVIFSDEDETSEP